MDDCCIAIALALAIKKKKRAKKRKRLWMKESLSRWPEVTRDQILNELRISSPNDFRKFVIMNEDVYNELINLVGPRIEKQDTKLRDAIPAIQRLSVTLNFLATGNAFAHLTTRGISEQSIGVIVMETCEAITEALKDYIQLPKTKEDWKPVADEFYRRWFFPNCLGALDGRHVAIRRPPGNGIDYFNYKKFYSIVIMALVNANHEFMLVDVGINGKNSDGGVFDYTDFGKALAEKQLKLPDPSLPPLTDKKLPYVFVAGDAIELTQNIMIPYSQTALKKEQQIFNNRLNRARRTVENVFGVLVSRFGVLQKPIGLIPKKAETIVLSCCYLHNYLRRKLKREYLASDSVDKEMLHDGSVVPGSWRKGYQLTPLQNMQTEKFTNSAKETRDKYCHYFNNEGRLSWQTHFESKE